MAEQQRQDEDLDVEDFDLAASRPAMLFGLPHSLSATLLGVSALFLFFYDPGNWIRGLMGDAIFLGFIAMIWTTAKVMLRSDYHGWDNFLAYMRLDFWCLDTKEWGGARVASLPLRSLYRCGAYDA